MTGVLQYRTTALQNLTVEYLSVLPGDLNSPRFLHGWWQL